MYIYHVENVRSGQGGRLYLENPQNRRFWSFLDLGPFKQLAITFVWYDPKPF